jgi:hypothetical protein
MIEFEKAARIYALVDPEAPEIFIPVRYGELSGFRSEDPETGAAGQRGPSERHLGSDAAQQWNRLAMGNGRATANVCDRRYGIHDEASPRKPNIAVGDRGTLPIGWRPAQG